MCQSLGNRTKQGYKELQADDQAQPVANIKGVRGSKIPRVSVLRTATGKANRASLMLVTCRDVRSSPGLIMPGLSLDVSLKPSAWWSL